MDMPQNKSFEKLIPGGDKGGERLILPEESSKFDSHDGGKV
jgi:hypothetical protein